MNSVRITTGTVSITTADGEVVELPFMLDCSPDRPGCANRVAFPTKCEGTFAIDVDNSAAIERLFNEMQAEYLRQQFEEAMRDGWRLLSIVDPSARTLEPGEMVTMQRALDRWKIIEPVYHEPRRKVAQWKRERSPMRYTRN